MIGSGGWAILSLVQQQGLQGFLVLHFHVIVVWLAFCRSRVTATVHLDDTMDPHEGVITKLPMNVYVGVNQTPPTFCFIQELTCFDQCESFATIGNQVILKAAVDGVLIPKPRGHAR